MEIASSEICIASCPLLVTNWLPDPFKKSSLVGDCFCTHCKSSCDWPLIVGYTGWHQVH